MITETSSEVRFQLLLCIADLPAGGTRILLLLEASISDTFTIEQNWVICIYAGYVMSYCLIKALLYTIAGLVFFDKKKNEQWLKAYLFLLSCEGVLLFPVVMLLSYFDLSLQVAVIYTMIVLVLVKILSFYKSYLIFFKRNGLFLQIILYFCALEVSTSLRFVEEWTGIDQSLFENKLLRQND